MLDVSIYCNRWIKKTEDTVKSCIRAWDVIKTLLMLCRGGSKPSPEIRCAVQMDSDANSLRSVANREHRKHCVWPHAVSPAREVVGFHE